MSDFWQRMADEKNRSEKRRLELHALNTEIARLTEELLQCLNKLREKDRVIKALAESSPEINKRIQEVKDSFKQPYKNPHLGSSFDSFIAEGESGKFPSPEEIDKLLENDNDN